MERPHIMYMTKGLVVSRTDTIDGVDYRLYAPDKLDVEIVYTDNLYVFLEKTVSILGEKYRYELKWWLYL